VLTPVPVARIAAARKISLDVENADLGGLQHLADRECIRVLAEATTRKNSPHLLTEE
jgi:hypothetical protein